MQRSSTRVLLYCILYVVGFYLQTATSAGAFSPEGVTISLEASPTTLDPVAVLDVHSQMIATAAHSPLAWVDQNGHLEFIIADRMEISPDGLNLKVQIRKNSRFWDGTPVRATDVRYSYERFCSSSHPHRWVFDRVIGVNEFEQKATNHIGGIVVEGDLNLTIRFSKPEPEALWLFSSLATSIVKEGSDTKEEKPFGSHVVGCGPFRPETLKPGETFEFSQNPGFPLSKGINKIKFIVAPDAQARLQAARQGKTDLIRLRGPMLSEASELHDGVMNTRAEFSSMNITVSRANELTFLIVNWKSEKLSSMSDVERRMWFRSISSQMSREAMVQGLYLGTGAETAYHIAPPVTVISEEKADRKPQSSQVKEIKGLNLLSANDAASRQLATYVQSRCHDAGLPLGMQYVELSTLIQRLIDKNFDIAILWVEQQIVSNGPLEWISFFNPKAPLSAFGEPIQGVDTKVDLVRGMTDLGERNRTYAKLLDFIDEKQTTWVPLASRKAVFLVNKKLKLFCDRNGTPVTGLLEMSE